jgi:hypothetical protein
MRRGKHPFSADREHTHHKLLDLGWGNRRILLAAYVAGIVLGAAGLCWYTFPSNLAVGINLAAYPLPAPERRQTQARSSSLTALHDSRWYSAIFR